MKRPLRCSETAVLTMPERLPGAAKVPLSLHGEAVADERLRNSFTEIAGLLTDDGGLPLVRMYEIEACFPTRSGHEPWP